MLFKNIVFVAAMLLSPSTVVGRTLKSNKGDKGANKREKRFEETIDALNTRIDTLTTLVEQIVTSVGNNDKDDSALGEVCGQAVADNFACENASEIEPSNDDIPSVAACTAVCVEVLSGCEEACVATAFFPPAFVICEVACVTAEGLSLIHI